MSTFAHSVASFDPTPTSVLLWTRLTGATSAEWAVGTDPDLNEIVAGGTAQTGPERDYTVVVDAGGLSPGTTYWYRFQTLSERSPVGRTRTLPEGAVDGFHLGMVSCARYSIAPLSAYRALGRHEVDLVLHLGDYIYDDAGDKGPRSHDPDRELVELDDYRRRIAQIRSDPDCQALHLRHPMVFVWDDHDFADNAWSGGAKDHDPKVHGDWSRRRDASVQAHEEWLPWRRTDSGDSPCIYRNLPIGDLADLIVVDSRIAGRDAQASFPGSKPLDDPARSLLGHRQWRWLEERLDDDLRPWALVANGVVVNPIPLSLPLAPLSRPLLPEGYVAVDEGRILRDDQWDGYPGERKRLVKLVEQRAGKGCRTVLLSGDVHSSWAFQGPEGADGLPVAVEVTVPSVSSPPLGRSRIPGMWRLLDRAVSRLDHVRWADLTARGYAVLEVRPEEVRVGWWFVNPYDAATVPEAVLGASFACGCKGWPPAWEHSNAPHPPTDRVAAPELPPRPDDVGYMRRWHLTRRWGLSAAAAGLAATAIAWVGRSSRRSNRR